MRHESKHSKCRSRSSGLTASHQLLFIIFCSSVLVSDGIPYVKAKLALATRFISLRKSHVYDLSRQAWHFNESYQPLYKMSEIESRFANREKCIRCRVRGTRATYRIFDVFSLISVRWISMRSSHWCVYTVVSNSNEFDWYPSSWCLSFSRFNLKGPFRPKEVLPSHYTLSIV